MPGKKKGVTHGDGKTGPLPLWVAAELLLVVLVKYITLHLFYASPSFSFPSNNAFTLPLEYEDLEISSSKVLVG